MLARRKILVILNLIAIILTISYPSIGTFDESAFWIYFVAYYPVTHSALFVINYSSEFSNVATRQGVHGYLEKFPLIKLYMMLPVVLFALGLFVNSGVFLLNFWKLGFQMFRSWEVADWIYGFHAILCVFNIVEFVPNVKKTLPR